jgi:cytidylate kinase
VADRSHVPCIFVLAGTNGAGKSSIAGAMFRQAGAEYFNPDEAARLIQSANPGASPEDANAAAWQQGVRLLERAIAERCDFAFETTLGGKTITGLLERALSSCAGRAARSPSRARCLSRRAGPSPSWPPPWPWFDTGLG